MYTSISICAAAAEILIAMELSVCGTRTKELRAEEKEEEETQG